MIRDVLAEVLWLNGHDPVVWSDYSGCIDQSYEAFSYLAMCLIAGYEDVQIYNSSIMITCAYIRLQVQKNCWLETV